ncbi:hypothetical protein [Mesorhizobium sp. B2-6-2]|uniref:hypothetical protein n=1 Tax=Mesorhizobium sp. B2-6-2 TaxID=2589915 RepID=UPI00112D4426|nr:hypothetical protein [Mesorhizobium sp. B2-6-2]TPJ78366.1 hypothetical protein FJ419_12980 [Mesorhizobium sp. B2-6-2]
MNDHRLPGRNKALIAAFVAIGVAGLLLRPIFPKSIFVALLAMSTFLEAYLIFWFWRLFQEWKQSPTLQKRLSAALFFIALGASLYMTYLTLRSILLR